MRCTLPTLKHLPEHITARREDRLVGWQFVSTRLHAEIVEPQGKVPFTDVVDAVVIQEIRQLWGGSRQLNGLQNGGIFLGKGPNPNWL